MVFAVEEGQNEADQTPKSGKKVAVNKRERPARKKCMDRAYSEWPPFKCKVAALI